MHDLFALCPDKNRNQPPTLTRVPQTAKTHRIRRFAPALALALLTVLSSSLFAQTAGVPSVALPGHVIKSLANTTLIPHTTQMDEEPITLTVVLNLSDPAGASALEQEMVDSNSANFQKTISPTEFTARFGPTQEAWNTVLAHLQQNGFTLSLGSPNRRTLTVRGTRAQAQKAFQVTIDDYQLGTRTFHAIAKNPAVPATVAPLISSVFGLTNLARMQPASGPFPYTPASISTAYNGSLTPAGKTNTSGLPPGLNGAGQSIALLEFDGFEYSDVKNWLKFAGLPSNLINHLSTVNIDGGTAPSGCTQTEAHCGTTEALLDIEAAMGIAQGAGVVVYDAPSDTDLAAALNYAGNDLTYGAGNVLSTSWGECEGDVSASDAASIDSIINDFQFWGITVFAASGDTGATCTDGNGPYPGVIAFPADAPHAVAVGGTSLNVNPDNSYNTENWWKNSGGFGVSQFIGEPSYQSKLYPGATGRSVPDVSMDAGDGIVVCQATPSISPDCGTLPNPDEVNLVGGTSLSTPLMAATWAIANQANEDATGLIGSAGNGYFYKFQDGFHAASTMTGTGNNFQHVGLGSPDITKLIAKIVPPRVDSYSPENGPASGGTKITIRGAGFIGVEKVTFGGAEGTHLTIDSDKQLTVETPEAPAEEATIKVETPGGTATAAGPYTYNPEIDKVSPSSGPMEGGTIVTLTGRALSTSEIFIFGEARATKVACPSSTSCTMLTPANPPGQVIVQAQTVWGYGYSPITSATRFTYQSPAITSFTPSVGPTTGGMMVYLYGVSLESGKTTVTFGDVKATGVHCPDPTYCYMTSPAHAAGKVPVTVTTNGITTAPAKEQFTFAIFPTVTGISVNVGEPGAVVTLTGTGFSTTAGKTTFTFFGIPVVGTCTSATQCTAVVPYEVDGTAQSTAVTVTVNGITSLDWVVFSYKNRIIIPCKGTTCT
jgi:Pro-kumamolisin, activation domain/IPT/TIG domain